MRLKKFFSLILAVVLCLSSFTAFANAAEEVKQIVSEEIMVEGEEVADNPAGETDSVPEDEGDESIDYSYESAWAYWSEGENTAADLFFICPTVDMGKNGNFNADIENEKYRKSFVGAINMELGIYDDTTVYAPYYRQATFPVYSMPEEEREAYLELAYQDIKKAFNFYWRISDPTRPLILAGFSQGADLTIRLLKEFFDDPRYQRRLVAAYAIGWKLTEDEVKKYPHLLPAMSESDTGVIIAFNSEAEGVKSSIIVGENEKTYAINPLNWKTTSEKADKSLNKGACFTDYSGEITEEIDNLTGAYIDEVRGTLKVTDVEKEKYSSSMFDEGVYHLYDYQFFFRNLQENVKTRISAYNEKYKDRLNVFYNYNILIFDVEPKIENGRTLVPMRAIFEAMGCAVYYSESDGKQIISARRANDVLILTIGEDKMYFNGKEIALDVPAKIEDGRTLIPIRAVSEAFECEVHWYGENKMIDIYSPANAYSVEAEKLSEIITDDEGNVLIEAIAYYPVINNYNETPCLDTINFDYKYDAEKFIEEARAKKEDALNLKKEMGETFVPFVYELTFEQTYNIWGYLSFTNHKYINAGGVHPSKLMESRTYGIGSEGELSVSDIIAEDEMKTSLPDYVTNLFVDKFKEIAPESADIYNFDYIKENIGYVQFYITKNSLVLYFNQGEITPYALGVISVEIPYNPELFYIDMTHNYEEEHMLEYEYDKGYEWIVSFYSKDKIELTEENIEYPPEEILSEYYPVGMKKFTVKGIEKGNGAIILAYVKKDEGLESAIKVLIPNFYVDENKMLTLVTEDEYMMD